jgi:hypothetical protein
MSELRDTIAVINDKSNIEVINLGLLKLFIRALD